MLKFFLILILILYCFYRVAGFLFRFVFGNLKGDPAQFNRSSHDRPRQAPNSNLKVDSVPRTQNSKKGDFNGGEYVDYEEV